MAEAIRAMLRDGGRVRLRVEGDSMLPWLRGGRDDVILVPAGNRRWGTGDIVLVRDPRGRFILHRVVRRADGRVWVLGDAQTRPEGPWSEAGVEALVDRVVLRGREIDMRSFPARVFATAWGAARPFRRVLLRTALSVRARLRRRG